jgi:uncharacterized protein with HEPN domain
MNDHDRIRFRHMRDAAAEICVFVRGKTRPDLDTDRLLVLALSMLIGIPGEAASRISPEVRAQHSAIPWTQIIGMRNRLIHGYFDINMDVLWETAAHRVPPFLAQVEAILESDNDSE